MQQTILFTPLIYHSFYVSIVYASAADSNHVDQQPLFPLVLGVVHANVGQKHVKGNIFTSSDNRSNLSTFHLM